MRNRSNELEIMDLGNEFYTQQEYNNCVYQIGRIGKYFGNENKMYKIFSKYNPESILDVGCGGGNFTINTAKKFMCTKVVGIDINEYAIEYCNDQKKIHQTKNNLQNLKFELKNNPELNEENKSFDIVTTTLVLHHMNDREIVEFLKKAKIIAKKAIIINDLQRSWISYIFSMFIIPIFFNNRLVRTDSLLSIKKSFSYNDWKYYLEKSFEKNDYKISRTWTFRWIVEIKIND